MTIKEAFFFLKNKYEKNEEISEAIISLAMQEILEIKNHGNLILKFDKKISPSSLEEIIDILDEVSKGLPIQYVLGHTSFLNLEFYVDSNVLIPRPETEELVDYLIKKYSKIKKPFTFVDVGTGSGAIAISLAKKFKYLRVLATDDDEKALQVAMHNASMLDAKVEFYLGDLLQPLIEKDIKVDVVIANLPYIENEEDVEPIVLNNEPKHAYLIKPGHILYEKLFKQVRNVMQDELDIYLEIHHDQKEIMHKLCLDILNVSTIECKKDMSGHDRFIHIHLCK